MNKIKRLLRIAKKIPVFFVIPLVILGIVVFYVHSLQKTEYAGSGSPGRTSSVYDEKPDVFAEFENGKSKQAKEDNGVLPSVGKSELELVPFRVTILDVGQASAAIIESNGHYCIFDGGDRQTSSFMVAYCRQQGIREFDYMVASHYHADHVYGLVGLLESGIKTEHFFCPDYVTDTNAQQAIYERVPEEKRELPYPGQLFELGSATMRCICPVSDEYSDDNGYSIGFIIKYKDITLLIDGDATAESESDMLAEGEDLDSDILIVPHHGSTYSSSQEWLDRVSPSAAVISCGTGNEYFHPHESVLKRLVDCGIAQDKLYRTDLNGTITITSNEEEGYGYVIEVEKEAGVERLWSPGEGENENSLDSVWDSKGKEVEDYYIGNKMSKKFHRPSCDKVPETDKQVIFADREKALSDKYLPCGECNP